ncbi:MAG: tetratricopeptide repeat protein, partial [Deltaproteobacteria bacterium]|nr:tetratricopeptide repeat protein [Deltaproteobacteria bacterium]
VWAAGALGVLVLTAAAASLSGSATVAPATARNPHEAASAAASDLPSDLPTLNEHAYRAILEGDLTAAMTFVERARQLDPDDLDVQVNVCALRLAVGMADRAEAGLDAVLAARPDHLRARLWKGLVRARLGDREAAERAWREVAERDPEGMEGAHARTLLAHPAPAGEPLAP